MNPLTDTETQMTVAPSTYTLGASGTEWRRLVHGQWFDYGLQSCGWMGVWDSARLTITKSLNRLVLSSLQQQGDCINPIGSGYFTLIFAAEWQLQNPLVRAVGLDNLGRWMLRLRRRP